MKQRVLFICTFCALCLFLRTSSSAQEAFLTTAKSMGGPGFDRASSLVVGSLGSIYTTGSFEGTADFDPGGGIYNLTSEGGADIFISKLDPTGNFYWAKNIGSTNQDRGVSIAVDAFENLYITGYFTGTVDFDPGSGIYNLVSKGSNDIFVAKFTSMGELVWAKRFKLHRLLTFPILALR